MTFIATPARVALLTCCLGLLPPASAIIAPEALWDPSPVPFLLPGGHITVDGDHTTTRPLLVDGTIGLDIRAGHELTLNGTLATDPALPPWTSTPLLKLGLGHLQLNSPSSVRGNTLLLQGSLGIAHDTALGPLNALDQLAGTQLVLGDGLTLDNPIQTHAILPPGIPPPAWGLAPITPTGPAAIWRVDHGLATISGFAMNNTQLIKDGAGTLRLDGIGISPLQPLTVQAGTLQVDGSWFGKVQVDQVGQLSGNGLVRDAQILGWLAPGTASGPDALTFVQHVTLTPTAQTRIRIDAHGTADQITSLGTARVGGTLHVIPTPGTWRPTDRWTILQAAGGLDYNPGPTPAPGGQATDNGRFQSATSTLSYLDPVLTYTPNAVILGLRYNPNGLNRADANWRRAILEDSRFLREAALAHTTSGRAWARTWAADTTHSSFDGQPGDARDTSGLQLGVSRAIGAHWHVAAFAGYQQTDLRSRGGFHQPSGLGTRLGLDMSTGPDAFKGPTMGIDGAGVTTQDATGRYQLRDRAMHIGLAASRSTAIWRLTAGAAQSWHHARQQRRVGSEQTVLVTRPQARLTQLWGEIRLRNALPVPGGWGLTPSAQLTWLRLTRPSYGEGGSLAATELVAQTERRWLSHLGLTADRPVPTRYGDAMISVHAGLQTLWGSRTLQSPQSYRHDPGTVFQAASLPMARHTLRLDVGIDAPLSRRSRLGFAYSGQAGGGTTQHGAWLNLTVALSGTSSSSTLDERPDA